MDNIGNISSMSLEITAFILPWIGIITSVIIAIWLKDFATNAAKGWAFKSNQSFNEGDHIILDGKDAIIVKIGLSQTVFGVYTEKGYTWRYIANDRLATQKIEKIINKDLHLDSDATKGKRIKELIAASQASQDAVIQSNAEKIRENQEKIDRAFKDGN